MYVPTLQQLHKCKRPKSKREKPTGFGFGLIDAPSATKALTKLNGS